jgi:hypothetical protein
MCATSLSVLSFEVMPSLDQSKMMIVLTGGISFARTSPPARMESDGEADVHR